ncbi:MAG: helix-turn-helix domain-containing protein [Xanthobacteraceae bacterium]
MNLRGAEIEVLVTARGDFRAELTQIDLPRLWIQRGRETLPRIIHGAVSAGRAAISFVTAAHQPESHQCGIVVARSDVIVNAGSMHNRTEAPCRWGSMSLALDDLAAAGNAMAGRDLVAPSHAYKIRPSPAVMSRLLSFHQRVERLARAAPAKLLHPEVAREIDHALVHAMVMCLTEGTPVGPTVGTRHHAAVMAKLESFLAEHRGRPVYVAEICAATGASERTLRACCREYLGMGVIRYLWLRRMHMAHRALVVGTPSTATVTGIATDCGFWELGRFSVEYRELFGELPSARLSRPQDQRPTARHGRSALPRKGVERRIGIVSMVGVRARSVQCRPDQ